MSESYLGGPSSEHEGSTAHTAKEQATSVAHDAAQSGSHLAGQARSEAGEIGREAGRQAKDVLGRGRSEMTEQASAQQRKLAQSVRTFGDELGSMAGAASEPGLASDLVSQVSGRADTIATWLEDREPGDLIAEVSTFARNRPGTFLALAVGAGLVAGRLTRGVKDAPSEPDTTGTDTTGGAAHRAPGAPSTSSAGLASDLPGATAGVTPQRSSAYGSSAGVSSYGTGAATGAAGSAYGTSTAVDHGTALDHGTPTPTPGLDDPLTGGYGVHGDDAPTQALPLSDALGERPAGTPTWPSTEGEHR